MEPIRTSNQGKGKRLVLSLPLIKKIVGEVENGLSRKEAVSKYGIGTAT